jgi:hypothetical protein
MDESTKEFETDRTRRFRAMKLDETEERAISDIETHGCQIIQVRSCTGPGWSYSLGVHDTCGGVEIIVVGLREETALHLLNEAARRLRSGVDLAEGRQREMIGAVECIFRPVDPKWVKHLMGWAIWYYGGTEFPVLQAIYPDLENRFPGEPDFDEAFAQPFLQPNIPMTITEQDFWAASDPASSLFNWKFPDPPHTRAFLSEAVHAGAEQVTYVSHDAEDGAWQFHGDSMSGGAPPVISCLHHPIDRDASLAELCDLPPGWWAERAKPGDAWIRHQHDSVEDD